MVQFPPKALPSDNVITVSVEHLRLWVYVGYITTIGLGMFITQASGAIKDPKNTLLTKVFGFNNVCINFDLAPANYVLPLVWACVLVVILSYCAVATWRARVQMADGALSPRGFWWFRAAKIFEGFSAIAFALIFAVSPPEEGLEHPKWRERLVIHTVPFFVFQLGMLSLAISTSLHGVYSGYWESLGVSSRLLRHGSAIYCVVFVIITILKMTWGIWCLAAAPWTPPQGIAAVSKAIDRVWLIFAIVIPVLKTIYFMRNPKIQRVQISLSLVDGASREVAVASKDQEEQQLQEEQL